MHGTFISRLEFTTNFGHTYSVGHDLPVAELDPTAMAELDIRQEAHVETLNFEVDMPYGSKVVSLSGTYNTNLLSIAAFYD